MEKEKKREIHITNNFNAPIGQHIDHVDNISLHMDARGGIQIVNNPQRQEAEAEVQIFRNYLLPQPLQTKHLMQVVLMDINQFMLAPCRVVLLAQRL